MAAFEELKKYFQRLADRKQFAHSYLFFGGAGDEKIIFTEQLANYIENRRWETNQKPLIDSLFLSDRGIDGIRAAIKFLWQKPLRSVYKTLVVPNAADLTLEAQNAILKIAEEPPPHALLILTVKDRDILLPTLVSRFQLIYFNEGLDLSRQGQDLGLAKRFFNAPAAEKKEIIKAVTDEPSQLEDFIASLIIELRRDKIKNWKILKELLHRWSMIKRYNTNKRLQLEVMTIGDGSR